MILDSGATESIYPLNYPFLSHFTRYPTDTYATMADQQSHLKLFGTAKYGIFDVLVADVRRPLLSEGIITGPPYNLQIVKSGKFAWILDPAKSIGQSGYIVCYCSKENDNLYHIHNPTAILNYGNSKTNINLTMPPNLKGNRQLTFNQSYGNLNPLEVLHVILGHIPEGQIKHMVKNNVVNGLKYNYDQIRHLKLGLCPTCMLTKMKAFPIYKSLSETQYGVFECISFDIVDLGHQTRSIDGYRYAALYVDHCTHKLMAYGMKHKSDLLSTLQQLIHQYGPTRNSKSLRLTYLNCDSGNEQLEKEFLRYCRFNNIYLLVSAPYKHQQNFIECFIGSIKNGIRVSLLYNKAPFYLWFHALIYYIHTYNQIPARSETRSKDECFYGIKPDVSLNVPFYAIGYAHRPKELRTDKVYSLRADKCRFIGYANDVTWADSPQISALDKTNFVSYKDSYIVLMDNGSREIRHDVIFELYPNQPSILKLNPSDRNPTDPNQDSDNGIIEYIQQFDEQLGHSIRNPTSIFSNPTLQSDLTLSSPPGIDQQQNQQQNQQQSQQQKLNQQQPTVTDRSKRSDKSTEKYLLYRSSLSGNQSSVNNVEKVVDNSPKSLLIPLTLEEALSGLDSDHWKAAWHKEMEKINDRKTWIPATTEEAESKLSTALKSKFKFRLQCKQDGSWKYKVRLVACGYSQVAGNDYHETYAPTAKFKSICIILNLAAIFDWNLHGLDIENAYLEADLDENIFMKLPTDVYKEENGNPVIVNLKKSLYGLKQAGELFYKFLKSILTDPKLGMICCAHDMCVFHMNNDETSEQVLVILWVDDIIVTGNSQSLIDHVIDFIESKVTKLSKDGEISRYIGIDITRDRVNHTIELTQVPYTRSVLGKLGSDLKPTSVPLNPYKDYRTSNQNEPNPPLHVELGTLRYLADRTKPILQLPLSLLASNAANPSQIQIDGVKHILRYLTGTIHDGITFARGLDSDPMVELFGISDASYMPGGDSRGQLAYAQFLNLNSGAIEVKSVKDSTVSTSATDIELKAIYILLLAIIWSRGFLSEIGFPQNKPTVIWTDSASAQILASTFQLSSKSQHLVMRINAIHQEIVNGVIEIKYVDTHSNVVDALTKALPVTPFEQHARTIHHGFRNIPLVARAAKTVKPVTWHAKHKKMLAARVRHVAHSN